MSFDLGVWYPRKKLSNEEAGRLYGQLCDGDASDILPHPAVQEFYAELTAKHPEIDTVPDERIDDLDYCPWSCALDHSSSHVIMACAWPKADYVYDLVKRLARKHGLALYDPQSAAVIYPDGSDGARRRSGTSFWILAVFGLVFAGVFVYAGCQLGDTRASLYAFGALCVLMSAGCVRLACVRLACARLACARLACARLACARRRRQ